MTANARPEVRQRATFRTRRALAPAWALVVLGAAIGAFAGGAIERLGFSIASGAVLAAALVLVAAAAELDRPRPRLRVAMRAAGAALAGGGVVVVVGRTLDVPWVPLVAMFLGPLAPCWIRAIAAERELGRGGGRAALLSRAFSRATFGVMQFYGGIVVFGGLFSMIRWVLGYLGMAAPRGDIAFQLGGAILAAAGVIALRNAGRVELSPWRGLRGAAPVHGPPRRLATRPQEEMAP